MGLLISRNYLTTYGYTLKPGGSPDASTSHIAHTEWIVTNYAICGTDDSNPNRCPSSDQLTAAFGYYNCGYGCQCYISDPSWPSCIPCNPFI